MLITKKLKAASNLVYRLVFRQVVNLFYRKVESLIKNGYCNARASSNEGVTSENQINLHITKQMSPPVSLQASENKLILK